MKKIPRGRVVASALILTTACSGGVSQKMGSNVRPPKPGIPQSATDITGIYRTSHQGLLQLRANGTYVMVISDSFGSTSGTYTLAGGRFEIQTTGPRCGSEVGSYQAAVTGVAEPDKAVLAFAPISDGCAERRKFLTIDPWIYAVS